MNSLHPKIPFRLLLSVPSTSTFLAGWQLLEPSSVDLTILQGGRGKKNALGAMLDVRLLFFLASFVTHARVHRYRLPGMVI